jgi:hydroxyethylthiazole kinase-like uncharacterized protein yjeF
MALERALPSAHHRPLHDTAASRRIEQHALAGLPPGTLMRRAGRSIARWVRALVPHGTTVWVAAGPGGNGGDGLHAAAELAAAGWSVAVSLLADEARLPLDAAEGLARARAAGVDWVTPDEHPSAGVAIDALLGLGSSRAPSPPIAHAIAQLNRLAAEGWPCLAVDLPSGLNADTGMPWGDGCVQASATLALLTIKPGHVTGRGRACCGDLWFDTLDVEPSPDGPPSAWLGGADWQAVGRMATEHDAHKGSFGDVLVVGGAPGMHGAARLAAHAAQGAGAGRTLVSLLDRHAPAGDVTRPEWLWPPSAWQQSPRELVRSVVVCGCGGGDEVTDALPPLLEGAPALVLDADALNAVSRSPALQTLLADRAGRGQATVLTPHPLEAARLLGCHTADVQAHRLAAAAALAQRFRAVALLKGSGTVIGGPSGVPWVNGTGNAALAHGGSGDVLAGWIGGLWSRLRAFHASESAPPAGLRPPRPAGAGLSAAVPPARDTGGGLWDLPLRCAAASAWLHGEAADRWPADAGRALGLVEAMRRIANGG